MYKEAYLYKKLGENKIRCDLCAHRCVVEDRKRGKCAVRENKGGVLSTLVYDKVISENVDPIEKKPLFHFMPGTLSFSIATPGCNFKCFFCQNWQISQMPDDYGIIEGKDIPPGKIVSDAIRSGCKSISYTYTEPTIYFELAYDTAKIAHSKGLKNIFVTNGFMTKECLEMVNPYLDAANVDLKSFSEDFYRDKIGGRLKPVLSSIKNIHDMGIWLEVTTLLIPGLNDSGTELKSIAEFIRDINPIIPWHISAYYPQYRSEIPPTGLESIKRALDTGKQAGLKYVYGGNIRVGSYENTVCPGCGETILERNGFAVESSKIRDGMCSYCNTKIDGVF